MSSARVLPQAWVATPFSAMRTPTVRPLRLQRSSRVPRAERRAGPDLQVRTPLVALRPRAWHLAPARSRTAAATAAIRPPTPAQRRAAAAAVVRLDQTEM